MVKKPMIFHQHQIYEFYPDYSNIFRNQIIQKLKDHSSQMERSHYILGRWENLYLDPNYIPELKDIFKVAVISATRICSKPLVVPHKGLGFPVNEFWFNVAKPGEKTGWHDHKDKAVISAVYYLKVPKLSGDIKFRSKENGDWQYFTAVSTSGKMILFNSSLEHSVMENNSNDERISLAFNLYSLPLEIQNDSDEYSSLKFFS